jgi:cytochrome P450
MVGRNADGGATLEGDASGVRAAGGGRNARLEGQIAIRMLLERFRRIELQPSSTRELRWRRGLVLRGLESLPVRLSRS